VLSVRSPRNQYILQLTAQAVIYLLCKKELVHQPILGMWWISTHQRRRKKMDLEGPMFLDGFLSIALPDIVLFNMEFTHHPNGIVDPATFEQMVEYLFYAYVSTNSHRGKGLLTLKALLDHFAKGFNDVERTVVISQLSHDDPIVKSRQVTLTLERAEEIILIVYKYYQAKLLARYR
jgi:hypothetical protein